MEVDAGGAPAQQAASAVDAREREAPLGPQRACLGFLFFSDARAAAGKRPMCLGVPYMLQNRVLVTDKQLALGKPGAEFKYACLGQSVYEAAPRKQAKAPGAPGGSGSNSASASAGGGGAAGHCHLPYCEGLEVMLASAADAAADAAAPVAGRRRQQQPHQPGEGEPQQPDELGDVLASIFGGEDSQLVKGWGRFHKIANRNWDRMKATASQAYAMTLGPLIDKLSGDSKD